MEISIFDTMPVEAPASAAQKTPSGADPAGTDFEELVAAHEGAPAGAETPVAASRDARGAPKADGVSDGLGSGDAAPGEGADAVDDDASEVEDYLAAYEYDATLPPPVVAGEGPASSGSEAEAGVPGPVVTPVHPLYEIEGVAEAPAKTPAPGAVTEADAGTEPDVAEAGTREPDVAAPQDAGVRGASAEAFEDPLRVGGEAQAPGSTADDIDDTAAQEALARQGNDGTAPAHKAGPARADGLLPPVSVLTRTDAERGAADRESGAAAPAAHDEGPVVEAEPVAGASVGTDAETGADAGTGTGAGHTAALEHLAEAAAPPAQANAGAVSFEKADESAGAGKAPEPAVLHGRLEDGVRMSLAAGGREVSISLRPEHLGHLRVRLHLDHGTVHARISVESTDVKAVFDADSARVRDLFARHGLVLGRYTVDLGHGGIGPGGGHGAYGGWGGETSSGLNAHPGGEAVHGGLDATTDIETQARPADLSYAGAGGIDVFA